jgi:uncharacterized Zn-finger protein
MPASVSVLPSAAASGVRKASLAPEKKYKCQFCNRAFSRSEHRSRHERSRKCFWGRGCDAPLLPSARVHIPSEKITPPSRRDDQKT